MQNTVWVKNKLYFGKWKKLKLSAQKLNTLYDKGHLNEAQETRKIRLKQCENLLQTGDKDRLRGKCQGFKNESIKLQADYLQHSEELISK